MRHSNLKLIISFVLVLFASRSGLFAQIEDDDTFFEAKVRPILVRNCYRCHGPAKQESGLRLDSQAAILAGGDRGASVVPGKPNESRLITAVSYQDDALQMPPKQALSKEEASVLTEWVRRGIPWPKLANSNPRDVNHWAFQPIKEPDVPELPLTSGNEIDQFIQSALDKHQITAMPRASSLEIIRRLALDLTGLPPDWSDVATFMKDPSDERYGQYIEELLSSPRYGERWGRHWLDLARYSDTQGGSVDCPIPSAYLYRDYVIDSFSNDKPYDQFIR